MSALVLDSTTKTIRVAMSAAAATTNPDFTVAYGDNTGTVFTEGANDGALSGTADVTVCAAPAAGTRRTVKFITITNRDTAAVTVIVKYDNNATQRVIARVTLAVNDTWTTDGTFDSTGSLKQTQATLPLGSLTGLGTGVAAFLATPSSANLLAAVADETGTGGGLVFATGPTVSNATLNGTSTFGGAVTPAANTANSVGYTGMPPNVQSANYTAVAADAGGSIIHPASDNNARTFTIPSNASVAFPIGTVITFANKVNTVTLAITTDTLTFIPTGATGSRTLAANGMATAVKISSTEWFISGVGLT